MQNQEDMSYVKKPIQILDRKVKQLRNKDNTLVKVSWRSQIIEEATWELEEEMLRNYPHLFEGTLSFEDETFLRMVEL